MMSHQTLRLGPLDIPLKEAALKLAKAGIDPWLKVHGKMKIKDTTKKQELELKECFELIDSGGSGIISTDDVPLAFSVLGMDVTKHEIEDAVRQISFTKWTMDFLECKRVILLKLDKLPIDEFTPSDEGKQASAEYTLPFAFLAQAYRRKKLIEAVMGGDKALQNRMYFRSDKSYKDRKVLREGLEKLDKKPEGNSSTTLEPIQRPKKRTKAVSLKKLPKPDLSGFLNPLTEPALPSYLIENVGSDVAELLLRENRKDTIKAILGSEGNFVPPTNKSIEIDSPLSRHGDKILSKAYLTEKLARFRSDMRHKPTMTKQVIRVRALKTLRAYYEKGSMQMDPSLNDGDPSFFCQLVPEAVAASANRLISWSL